MSTRYACPWEHALIDQRAAEKAGIWGNSRNASSDVDFRFAFEEFRHHLFSLVPGLWTKQHKGSVTHRSPYSHSVPSSHYPWAWHPCSACLTAQCSGVAPFCLLYSFAVYLLFCINSSSFSASISLQASVTSLPSSRNASLSGLGFCDASGGRIWKCVGILMTCLHFCTRVLCIHAGMHALHFVSKSSHSCEFHIKDEHKGMTHVGSQANVVQGSVSAELDVNLRKNCKTVLLVFNCLSIGWGLFILFLFYLSLFRGTCNMHFFHLINAVPSLSKSASGFVM